MELRQKAQLEELERQKIELKRKQHAERLGRVMDERNRQIGMDYNALEKQVQEKKEKKASEHEEEIAYQRRFLEEQRVLAHLAREEQKTRKEIDRETDEFRSTHQTFETRREYDLNRHDYVKAQPPVRKTENDEWLSVSGCQKMDGEDTGAKDRKLLQQQQLEKWYSQQKLEMENRKAKEIEDQKKWEETYLENDRMSAEIGAKEDESRKAYRHKIDQENAELARQKREKEEKQRADEQNQNASEIDATINSPIISEDRNQAVGVNGKMVTQSWKGMTDDQTNQFSKDREAQDKEASNAAQHKAEKEHQEEAERLRTAKNSVKRERVLEKEKKEQLKKLAEEQLKEAQLQKEAERKRNKETYGRNQPSDEFWNYFGKSDR